MDTSDYNVLLENQITSAYKGKFIFTPFAERFENAIITAKRLKQWGVIGAYSRNGKSWCLKDICRQSGAEKTYDGKTKIPVIAIRSPESKDATDLIHAISKCIGKFPKMSNSVLKSWILDNIPRLGIEQIIIDDAHELNMSHLRFIKWLTDSLELIQNYNISIIFISILDGNIISALQNMKQYSGEGWMQQMYERFYFSEVIPGLNPEEVYQVLDALEEIYRPFVNNISLTQYTSNIFGWLTTTAIDVHQCRRVAMDHLAKLIYESVKIACIEQKLDNIPGDLLTYVYKHKLLDKSIVYTLENKAAYKPNNSKISTDLVNY